MMRIFGPAWPEHPTIIPSGIMMSVGLIGLSGQSVTVPNKLVMSAEHQFNLHAQHDRPSGASEKEMALRWNHISSGYSIMRMKPPGRGLSAGPRAQCAAFYRRQGWHSESPKVHSLRPQLTIG